VSATALFEHPYRLVLCRPPLPSGPETLVNYFVGSHLLTLKAPMVRLLRECYADPDTVAPTSFVLTPNQPRVPPDPSPPFCIVFLWQWGP